MNTRHLLIVGALASLTGWASAQYKVVAPDGSVTYTDRPPSTDSGKVTAWRRPATGAAAAASAPAAEAALPFELRQLVASYPVTLYSGSNCVPCDNGRQLLRERGVPYTERSVSTQEDTAALARLTGGRTLPSLTIGQQPLRGFHPMDWGSYLDAAGYPKESRLPRNWQPLPATPLVAREVAPNTGSAAPDAAEPARSQAAPPAEPAASEAGLRF